MNLNQHANEYNLNGTLNYNISLKLKNRYSNVESPTNYDIIPHTQVSHKNYILP